MNGAKSNYEIRIFIFGFQLSGEIKKQRKGSELKSLKQKYLFCWF